MSEIDDTSFAEITRLSALGNQQLEAGQWRRAIASWQAALDLVPDPKADFEATVWLNASIGDAYLEGEQPQKALHHFEEAYKGLDGHLNPYVLVQLGRILADRGEWDLARDRLMRAYMLEGEEIFAGMEAYFERLRRDPEIAFGTG